MIIAVPFAGKNVSAAIAGAMIASCKRTMSDVEIWQITDSDTPLLPGMKGAIRRTRTGDWGQFFLEHMANLPQEEILRLDYDVIVQRDVREIFGLPFDVAFTRRTMNDPTCSNFIRVKNPHNHGVVFIRPSGKPLFEMALAEYMEHSGEDGWMDVTLAIENAAAATTCRWIELPGERYNYTPKRREEDVSHCAIVHYKGNRKWWMVGAESEEEAKRDGEAVLDMVDNAAFRRGEAVV